MRLSRGWLAFLLIALIAGTLLRTLHVSDMEYKEDEQYHYSKSQTIGHQEPWPWVGIPSGVYLVNPGMSVWVFAALAKISGATTPTELERSLQLLSLLGMVLLIGLATRFLGKSEPHEAWLWAAALALVNPFQVLYQRKLWPEPFFPFFTTLFLICWLRRDRWLGAFFWGLLGAMLGQIHMSGFFLAFALFLVTKISRPRSARWGAWFLGSCAGAWPLVPWALYVMRNPLHESMTVGWQEISQFKFWAFWITDALGLHLGNPLGLLRGSSNWAQISDFIRYPLIRGQATYLVGAAHLAALVSGLAIWLRAAGLGVRALWRAPRVTLVTLWDLARGNTRTETGCLITATCLGMGVMLTITGVAIRRYYMMVSFPLELVWLAWLALQAWPGKSARLPLGILWASQLAMSAGFVGYIHANKGSVQGDYGEAYHLVIKARPDLAFPK